MRRYWDDKGDHNIIELLIPLWAHIMLLLFILGMIFVIDDNMVYTTYMSAYQQHYHEYNEQKSCSWPKIVENFYEILFLFIFSFTCFWSAWKLSITKECVEGLLEVMIFVSNELFIDSVMVLPSSQIMAILLLDWFIAK